MTSVADTATISAYQRIPPAVAVRYRDPACGSKEPDRCLRLGLRDLDDRECGGEFTGVAGAASFITRMPLLHVGRRMRGTVLSCCCLGALASPGCLGDPLVPALPRTVTPVLGLNHSLRHLRRTRGLEANARAKIKDRSRWLGAINRNGAPRAQPVTFGWALFAPYYPCPWTLDREDERKPLRDGPKWTVVVRVEIKF